MIDYLLQEINEQPAYLQDLIKQSKEEIYELANKIRLERDIRKIILTGCGDSLCASLTTEARRPGSSCACRAAKLAVTWG